MGWESENRTWQTSAIGLSPSENFLFYHLEESLGVNRADVDLRLQASDLVRPRHRLARQSVGPELHEAFVDSVEERLVLDVN